MKRAMKTEIIGLEEEAREEGDEGQRKSQLAADQWAGQSIDQ